MRNTTNNNVARTTPRALKGGCADDSEAGRPATVETTTVATTVTTEKISTFASIGDASMPPLGQGWGTLAVEAMNTCDNSGRRRHWEARHSTAAAGDHAMGAREGDGARRTADIDDEICAEVACLRHATVKDGPEHTSERAVSGAVSEAGRRGAEWEHRGVACSMG